MRKETYIKMWITLLAIEAITLLVFGIVNAPLCAAIVRGTVLGKAAAGIQIFGGIGSLFIGK